MPSDAFAGLFVTPREGDATRARARIESCSSVSHMRPVAPRGWYEGQYLSTVPLLGEDPEILRPPYFYPLLCRFGSARFLVLSRTKEIVEHVLRQVWGRSVPFAARIGVDALVRDLARQPGRYVLSYVNARASAFGTALESLSFFGDDVAEALYFRQGLELFNCSSCGLRKATGGVEIVRLWNAGGLSLRYVGQQRLREVDELFVYLRKQGYVTEGEVVETGPEP